jgi:hypothetical protein
VLDHRETCCLKKLLEELIRSDDTVIVLVYVESRVMYILLDKDHAILFIDEVLARLHKELHEVFICQVAEDPLHPNDIVLVLKIELLQANLIIAKDQKLIMIELIGNDSCSLPLNSIGLNVFSSLLKLHTTRLDHVHLGKPRKQQVLGDSSHTCAAIEYAVESKPTSLKLVKECSRCVNVRKMHLPVPA